MDPIGQRSPSHYTHARRSIEIHGQDSPARDASPSAAQPRAEHASTHGAAAQRRRVRWVGPFAACCGAAPALPTNLSRQQRALVGVARWPDPRFNNEGNSANRAYGLAFAERSQELGHALASGEVEGLDALWEAARAWRIEQPDARGVSDMAEPKGSGQYKTHILPDKKYAYLAERVLADPRSQEIHSATDRAGRTWRTFFLAVDGDLGPVYLDRQKSTRLLVTVDDQNRLKVRQPLEDQESYMLHVEHPEDKALVGVAATCMAQARDPDAHLDARIGALAEMHWWLAHAMPDKRGSAAKSEMCVRAAAYSAGIELGPFKRGFVPDLEAFVTPRDEFVRAYAAAFDVPPAALPVTGA